MHLEFSIKFQYKSRYAYGGQRCTGHSWWKSTISKSNSFGTYACELWAVHGVTLIINLLLILHHWHVAVNANPIIQYHIHIWIHTESVIVKYKMKIENNNDSNFWENRFIWFYLFLFSSICRSIIFKIQNDEWNGMKWNEII